MRSGTARLVRVHSTAPLGSAGLILTTEHQLESGDRLLFYNAGVSNPLNGEGVPFGTARLTSAFEATRQMSAATAADYLGMEIERFTGGDEPNQGQTLLIVETR
jgi:serine phosphatase RsbU (regulator of sigma subunit)